MFSAPPVVGGQGAPLPTGGWTSGDAQLDIQLTSYGGLTEEASKAFMSLLPSQRLQIAKNTCQRPTPPNQLSAWIMGCVRRTLAEAGAKTAGLQAHRPVTYGAMQQALPSPARAMPYTAGPSSHVPAQAWQQAPAPAEMSAPAAQVLPAAMPPPALPMRGGGTEAAGQVPGLASATLPPAGQHAGCTGHGGPCSTMPPALAGGLDALPMTQESPRGAEKELPVMPAIVREALSCLPRDKGGCLRRFLHQIPAATQQEFLGRVAPWEQVFVAYAIMSAPKFWKKPGEYAAAFLKARSQSLGGAEGVGQVPGPTSVAPCKKICVAVYHGCCGIGTSAHVFERALRRILPELGSHGVEVHVSRAYGFDPDAEALAVARAWSGPLDLKPEFVEEDASSWLEHAEADCGSLKQEGQRAMYLFGSPCNNLTKSKPTNHTEGSGLHSAPSNAVWALHAGVTTAQTVLGGQVAFLSEQVKCAHEADDVTLNELWGAPRLQADSHEKHGRAKRERFLRSSPELPLQWEHVLPASGIAPPETDGWKWRGNAGRTDLPYLNTAVRGFMANIAEQYTNAVTFGEEPSSTLNKFELETYQSMMIEKVLESRLATRELLLWWMGMEDSGLLEVMSQLLPCHKFLFPTVGTAASAGDPGAQPCGNMRYCENCGRFLQLIGQAWEMHAMTDAVAAWAKRAFLHWAGVADAGASWFELKQTLVHRCCEECPLRLESSMENGGAF